MLFLSAALSPVEELLLSQGSPVSPSVQCSLQASKDLGRCQQVGLGYINHHTVRFCGYVYLSHI